MEAALEKAGPEPRPSGKTAAYALQSVRKQNRNPIGKTNKEGRLFFFPA